MFAPVNEVSIVVVALLSVALFHIWYSPLFFGPFWTRALLRIPDELDFSQKEMVRLTVVSILLNIFFFTIVAQWMAQSNHEVRTIYLACISVCGLMLASMTGIALWERRPLSYVLVHMGYIALVLSLGVGVIMYWPW